MEQVLSDRPYAGYSGHVEHNEAHSSGVSWSAVIAGAAVTAALSLILLALGAGLGLSSVSPYEHRCLRFHAWTVRHHLADCHGDSERIDGRVFGWPSEDEMGQHPY